jgi:hypothetical protein
MPNLIKFSWPFPKKKKGKTIIVVGGESTTGLLDDVQVIGMV